MRNENAFKRFRILYLIVYVVIMLADGMQGTHLFTLYSEYNYNVASLYAIGFLAGAITSPFIGAIVDKCGRRYSAIVYCVLEIVINILEQYKCFYGILLSRIIGGMTTNLLFTVFESWVITDHRKKCFPEEDIEIILRDSVIASNLSAIVSGIIAHYLAFHFGAVGPFQGAVYCTFFALVLIYICWGENYGLPTPEKKNLFTILKDGVHIVTSDSKILRIGLIQGLTEGTLQTFIFLWCPKLLHLTSLSVFSQNNDIITSIMTDNNKEPAYGLIFGAFMASGALGGYIQPYINKIITQYIEQRLQLRQSLPVPDTILPPEEDNSEDSSSYDSNLIGSSSLSNSSCFNGELGKGEEDIRSMAIHIQAGFCFLLSSMLFTVPIIVKKQATGSFTFCFYAFLSYEFLIGMYLPCEGILRSIYLPNTEVCTLMTLLRVIVNIIVAVGVFITNFFSLDTVFLVCSMSLVLAAILQFSLIHKDQWVLFLSQSYSNSIQIREEEITCLKYPRKIRIPSIDSTTILDDDLSEENMCNGNTMKQKSD